MNSQDFDRLLNSIREDEPSAEAAREAADRVRGRLMGPRSSAIAPSRLDSCDDFRALLPAYRDGSLGDARRMLLEDHLHACVACRKVFEGRGRAAVIPMSPRKSVAVRAVPWAIAAAVLVAAGLTFSPTLDRALAPSGPRATVASVDGELYRVSTKGTTLLTIGAPIGENEEIRTAKGGRAVLRLRDGSMVEIAERSDLSLSERWSGKTVHLERGSVMVEAAKQRRGRLEIATPDCLVSVKGTIFSVSRSLKGSRVSVVEGEVKVDEDGTTKLLHRGDQTATNPSMAPTPVAEDISWSHNSAKYLALLGELSAIEKKLEAIPSPGLRYSSKLAGMLPENTVIFASVPNIGATLAEANTIFEDRVRESAVLREWWNTKESQTLRQIVDRVRTFSDYLGDEIVLAVPAGNGALGEPMLFAEVRRNGLKEYVDRQFAEQGSQGPLVRVHGNLVAIAGASREDPFAPSAFQATPFWNRIVQSYQSGAGWLFAVNMEQIMALHVEESKNVTNAQAIAGIDNVRYLVIGRKDNLGRTENSASLSFSGDRRGLASWLAGAGPMGSLEFVSPVASFAGSFVVGNPGAMLQQLLAAGGLATGVAEFQQETGVNLVDDVASTLGGEMTIAVDGPILPVPSWKISVEVNNPTRLEWSIEQAVKAAQRKSADTGVQLAQQIVGGLTYYTLTSSQSSIEVDYVFTDGYLLMAANRALLTTSIQNRAAGITLSRASNFRAQLPQDGRMNFSALLYYNMGATVGPIVDQLKSTGIMTPQQQQAAALLTSNREPTLIYAYAQPDRIDVASRGNFFGLGLDTLVGLNGGGASLLSHLLPPVFAPKKSPQ